MAMTPFRVVEHFNVVEDIRSGLFAGGIDAAANPFALEQLEEAFGHGIVMAITPAAHTGFESMGLEEVAPVVAAELAALIAVDDDLGLWATAPDGRQQGVEHQLAIDTTTHRPAHHGASKEVEHHRQIQPSLMGADVGDVSHPRLIGRAYVKLLLQEVLGHQAGAPASIAWPALVTRLGAQVILPHEPCHPVPAAALTQIPQIVGDFTVAVDLTAVVPALADEPYESSILQGTSAVWRTAPG